jgi:hypothetical protein
MYINVYVCIYLANCSLNSASLTLDSCGDGGDDDDGGDDGGDDVMMMMIMMKIIMMMTMMMIIMMIIIMVTGLKLQHMSHKKPISEQKNESAKNA